MPAIVRATPTSLIPLRRPVVPGELAQFAVTDNALILLDSMSRDVTVATEIHMECPVVAPVFRRYHRIDVRAGDPRIRGSGQSTSSVDYGNHHPSDTGTTRERLERSTNRIQSRQVTVPENPVQACSSMFWNRQQQKKT